MRAEGFTDVRYVDLGESTPRGQAIARGTVDFSTNFAAPLIVAVASGEPVTFLAGVHVGCFELFGNDSIRTIADLKDKSVGPGIDGSANVPKAMPTMSAYNSAYQNTEEPQSGQKRNSIFRPASLPRT